MPITKSCIVSWNGTTVAVTARAVPRYAWMTVSIDVAVGNETILKTGGVLKAVGDHAECFEFRGATHKAQVTWGKPTFRSFPFTLHIDGAPLLESRVPVENWWLTIWPWALLAAFIAWRRFA